MNLVSLRRLGPLLAVLACTLWVYLPGLHGQFLHWDDNTYVTYNPYLDPLNLHQLAAIFTTLYTGNWHPLTLLSHAIDVQLFGRNAPAGHHLISLLLHLANTVLVYRLTLRLAARVERGNVSHARLAALLTAAVFALHPQHVESVAWIAERKDVLYSLFYLAALLRYLDYTGSGLRRPYLQSLALFALALMAKPMAVTLPAVLVLIDRYPLRRLEGPGLRKILVEKLPFFALTVLLAAITVYAQARWGALQSTGHVPIELRLLNAAHSVLLYLEKLAIPLNLLPHYVYPPEVLRGSAGAWLGLGLIGAVSLVALWRWWAAARPWATVWLLYLCMLSPVLGIVQAGDQAAGDRFAYLATLPIYLSALVVAVGWVGTQGRLLKATGGVTAVALLLIYAVLVRAQLGIWHSDGTLWQYVVSHSPGDSTAHNNLGNVYLQQGKTGEALTEYQQAHALAPAATESTANVGTAYLALGQPAKALDYLLQVHATGIQWPELEVRIATAYLQLGKDEPAENHLQQALNQDPTYDPARLLWAQVLANHGRLAEARAQLNAVLEHTPDSPLARRLLARLPVPTK